MVVTFQVFNSHMWTGSPLLENKDIGHFHHLRKFSWTPLLQRVNFLLLEDSYFSLQLGWVEAGLSLLYGKVGLFGVALIPRVKHFRVSKWNAKLFTSPPTSKCFSLQLLWTVQRSAQLLNPRAITFCSVSQPLFLVPLTNRQIP